MTSSNFTNQKAPEIAQSASLDLLRAAKFAQSAVMEKPVEGSNSLGWVPGDAPALPVPLGSAH